MTALWTAQEAAKATGGAVESDWEAQDVSIDSRTLKPGDLFIALKGARHDGHVHAVEALDKGAAAVCISKYDESIPRDKCLIAADTTAALQALGYAARSRTGAKITAVTGSVGKTGVKDMLYHAFSAQTAAHASEKSFNNHWGAPLTLARMPLETKTGIFELGMNHAGEITPLSEMVKPHIAIITTVEAVHIENFSNGIEGVAHAKSEILNGVAPGGAALLNADNEWFEFLSQKATKRKLDIYSFGRAEPARARLISCDVHDDGLAYQIDLLGETISGTLPVMGTHHALNLLPVLLSVKLSGYDPAAAAHTLADWVPRDGRGRKETIPVNDGDPVTLFDESYNASPVATRAAIAVLGRAQATRKVAILGDMAELGDEAATYHAALAKDLKAANIDAVYTCETLMGHLNAAGPAPEREHYDSPAAIAEKIPQLIKPGDAILVKGSRGGAEKPKMQVIIEAIRALGGNT